MARINKTLNSYITQLLILGIIYFVVSIGFGIVSFRETETTPIFVPLIIICGGFGYYIVTFMGKGGNVNYYFKPHTPNENEKLLSDLIEKYRNIWLMTFCAIILIFAEILMVTLNLDNTNPLRLDYVVGAIIMSTATVLGICEGVKFISAWWNIKKNWRKIFNT